MKRKTIEERKEQRDTIWGTLVTIYYFIISLTWGVSWFIIAIGIILCLFGVDSNGYVFVTGCIVWVCSFIFLMSYDEGQKYNRRPKNIWERKKLSLKVKSRE